jgi:hypothetical protein
VTDPHNQLREAFETHEDLTPDPAAVYARVQDLSRTYKRRRRSMQAAGGAVLGVGLITGALNLPVLFQDKPAETFTMVAPAAPAAASPTPSATPSLSPEDLYQKRMDAYFQAGYGYDDALKLAKLWKMDKNDALAVKAEAGKRLLEGKKLPIRPTPDVPVTEEPVDPKNEARWAEYFAKGYDYNDAVKLAKIWKMDKNEIGAVKAEAGRRLLAGETLPVRP